LAWRPGRDLYAQANALVEAALDPSASIEQEPRPGGWTLVARTLWPQTAAALLVTRASTSQIGFFAAGFVRSARDDWSMRVEIADEWFGPDLAGPAEEDVWSYNGIWGWDAWLFAGEAAPRVAHIRATTGLRSQALRPQRPMGAFVLAAQSTAGEKLAIEALDAAGPVLDRHETSVA
jgi:hypothetical protein